VKEPPFLYAERSQEDEEGARNQVYLEIFNRLYFSSNQPPDETCDKTEEWPEEEKHSLINFYSQNQEFWNHTLKDYHDRSKSF